MSSGEENNNFENNDDNDEEVEHTNEDEDNNNNNNATEDEDEDKNEDLQHPKKKKKTQIIEEGEEESSFESFGLDPRLLKAVQKSNFHKPTIVQTAAIPLALKGKDILAKAKTGSGKTAAYLIPILQQLINEIEKNNDQTRRGVRVLILVPSAELSAQVYQQIKQLTIYLSSITFYPLSRSIPLELQKTRLAEMPDIVISTPSQLIPHLRNKDINLKDYPGLGWVVLDEADLLMSYGYEDDLKEIASHLPKAGCQAFLMSATLSSGNEEESLDSLKDLILSNPAILKLEEAELRDKDFLQQFTISCSEEDKFLVLFVLIKLRLIRGKIIFFVNEIDRCYRLKLFFERFSIKAAVLNSELPQVSRNHIIMEFNKGVFDYLIATDENLFNTNQKQGKRKKDKEYLVARGVDFKFVKAVVNFDLPPTKEAYVHRIGRTARGGTKGLALSFVTPRNDSLIKEIQEHVEAEGYEMKPFAFNMNAIEGFRYRVEDVSRSVTKVAIREARIKELKAEIFNSSKLKAHFEDNPQDLAVLQHDQTLQQSKVQPHLRVVPDYLLKDVKKKGVVAKVQNNAPTKRKWEPKKSSKQSDPLKTFSFKKRKTD